MSCAASAGRAQRCPRYRSAAKHRDAQGAISALGAPRRALHAVPARRGRRLASGCGCVGGRAGETCIPKLCVGLARTCQRSASLVRQARRKGGVAWRIVPGRRGGAAQPRGVLLHDRLAPPTASPLRGDRGEGKRPGSWARRRVGWGGGGREWVGRGVGVWVVAGIPAGPRPDVGRSRCQRLRGCGNPPGHDARAAASRGGTRRAPTRDGRWPRVRSRSALGMSSASSTAVRARLAGRCGPRSRSRSRSGGLCGRARASKRHQRRAQGPDYGDDRPHRPNAVARRPAAGPGLARRGDGGWVRGPRGADPRGRRRP